MKKTYIKPAIEVSEFAVESHLMAASNEFQTKGDYDETVTDLGKKHTFDVWGFDEDED